MDSRDHLPMRLSSSEPPGTMMGSFSYSQPLPSNAGTVAGVNLSFGHVSSSQTSRPAEVQVQAYNGDGLQGMRPAGGFSIGDPMRKKRGRPRKYGPDGNLAPGYPESLSSEPSVKRRGRPPGSGRKQQFEALDSILQRAWTPTRIALPRAFQSSLFRDGAVVHMLWRARVPRRGDSFPVAVTLTGTVQSTCSPTRRFNRLTLQPIVLLTCTT